MIVYYSTNAVIENFSADCQPHLSPVMTVDIARGQIQYSVEPGWQDPTERAIL